MLLLELGEFRVREAPIMNVPAESTELDRSALEPKTIEAKMITFMIMTICAPIG